ncbi:class I SAM-dependent methyltransferase [Pseudalkalibacillus sp. Hm43]|uniref:class I SAM-dependent methyltransferase n=1 Tax=Pseudalkalibacillus sp. Hm43 TaxID=3450742 RepID=UPI003F420D89
MNWAKSSVNRWNEQAAWWDEMESIWQKGPRAEILKFFFNFIGNQPQKILDLGCGPGVSTKRMNQSGHCAIGADHSPEMVQKAGTRGVEAHVCTDNRLPFPDEAFDVVFACTSLEWTNQPHELIKEASRVLKKDGKFVAVTLGPYAVPRTSAYDRLYGKEVVHNMMMPWELHRLMEEHGFTHKENYGVYSGKNRPDSNIIPLLKDNWVAKSSLSFLYAFAATK